MPRVERAGPRPPELSSGHDHLAHRETRGGEGETAWSHRSSGMPGIAAAGHAAGDGRERRRGAGERRRRERGRPFKEGRDRRRGDGLRFGPESVSWTDLGWNRSNGWDWE